MARQRSRANVIWEMSVDKKGGPLNNKIVPLKGHAPFGNADTIVERQGGLPAGGTGLIDIEIVAMNLVSTNPIPLDLGGGVLPYEFHVSVDPNIPSVGLVDVLQHNDPTGGSVDVAGNVELNIDIIEVGQTTPALSLNPQLFVIVGPVPFSHTPVTGYTGTPNAGGFYYTESGYQWFGSGQDQATGIFVSFGQTVVPTVIPLPAAHLMGLALLGAVGGLAWARRRIRRAA